MRDTAHQRGWGKTQKSAPRGQDPKRTRQSSARPSPTCSSKGPRAGQTTLQCAEGQGVLPACARVCARVGSVYLYASVPHGTKMTSDPWLWGLRPVSSSSCVCCSDCSCSRDLVPHLPGPGHPPVSEQRWRPGPEPPLRHPVPSYTHGHRAAAGWSVLQERTDLSAHLPVGSGPSPHSQNPCLPPRGQALGNTAIWWQVLLAASPSSCPQTRSEQGAATCRGTQTSSPHLSSWGELCPQKDICPSPQALGLCSCLEIGALQKSSR